MGAEICEITDILGRKVSIHFVNTGRGANVFIEGGDSGHIGATAIACPNHKTEIWELENHKEGELCKIWAESLTRKYMEPVVVSAGIHFEEISKKEIKLVMEKLKDILMKWDH